MNFVLHLWCKGLLTGSFDEFNLAATSESIPDKYSPWNPDNDSIEDALFPSLGSDLCNQPLFSEYEPDLSESTPSNHSNLNHHLTNFPANLACPQDSRPVAVANPLSRQQDINDNPANSAEIVGNKYSQVQRKKKRCKNPRYSEWQKEKTGYPYISCPYIFWLGKIAVTRWLTTDDWWINSSWVHIKHLLPALGS